MLGSVYRRKDGLWCSALQQHRKRKVVYARTEQAARRKLANLQRQSAIIGRLPDPGRRTVNDVLAEWLKSAMLKPRTRADYENLGRRYIEPAIGHVRLSRPDSIHLQRLYVDLQARGLHRIPAQVHAVMHRVLAIAVRWGWRLGGSHGPVTRVPSGQPSAFVPWSGQTGC